MSLYRIAILTASDKGAAGLREDRSGPVIAAALASVGTIVTTSIVADDRATIAGQLRRWADSEGIDLILDVGANTGQFATRLRQAGYRGRIESFEPVPETVAVLRKAARDDPRWRVHELALGEEDGTAVINVTPGTLSSLLAPSEYGRSWSRKMR